MDATPSSSSAVPPKKFAAPPPLSAPRQPIASTASYTNLALASSVSRPALAASQVKSSQKSITAAMVGVKFINSDQIRLGTSTGPRVGPPAVQKPFNPTASTSLARAPQPAQVARPVEPEPLQELPDIDSE